MDDEVSALIDVLHETGRRLEKLTAGQVDAVADRHGRPVLLQRSQDDLRRSEMAKQAAIVDALPAHIALLDAQGTVASVNHAWRLFAHANGLQSPDDGSGLNYLEVCDRAQGDDASVSHQAAKGIRSVLYGGKTRFSMEYPCHSPTEQRWFIMTATPLAGDRPNGAVVMHVNITDQKRSEDALRRFSAAMDSTDDAIFLIDRTSMRIVHVNEAACRLEGQTRAELLSMEPWRMLSTSRAELERSYDALIAGDGGPEQLELPYRRKDGSEAWLELRRNAQRSGDRWTIVTLMRDITERKRAQDATREAEERFSGAFTFAPIGMALVSPDGRWLKVNRSLCELVGYSEAELLTRTFQDITCPDDLEVDLENVRRLIAGEIDSYTMEKRYIHASGRLVPAWLGVSLVRDERDQPLYFVSQVQDLTDRKEAEARIRHLNRVYSMLSAINTLTVRVRVPEELFRESCRIAVELGEFRMAMIGLVDPTAMKVVSIFSSGKDAELLAIIKDRLASREGVRNTMVGAAIREKKAVIVNDSQNDSRVVFARQYLEAGVRSMAVLPLMIADQPVGVLVLYAREAEFFREGEMKLLTELAGDVAFAIDHIEKQARLDYLAYYDTLTGLANRTLFFERVGQVIRTASSAGHQLAVCMVDLERFKNINDSVGREAGDALLRQVAEWLTRGSGDASLLARVGADHFAAVLPKIRREGDVSHLVEKALGALASHPFRLGDDVLRISAKVGIALFPDDGADAETLFRNAEAALKNAKASGAPYLFFTQRMTEERAGKVSLESRLRAALERGEFVLHYQPKVTLLDRKLAGAEALIRWNDPRTGLVPPGQFIPILEETGLIHEVGRWALRKAIEDYLRWRAAGFPAVRVAVNVSPMQLRRRNFVDEIREMIGMDAHAAAGLEIELTESLIMEDVKHSIASLRAIRALGVKVAIDDFGTGFSSLSYLAKLPVDTLKIDRFFVNDMTSGPEGLALVSTIVGLAHSLKLCVVAEGVETEEQSRLLLLLRCDEMQGFLLSKPLPGALFETRFLASGLPAGDRIGTPAA